MRPLPSAPHAFFLSNAICSTSQAATRQTTEISPSICQEWVRFSTVASYIGPSSPACSQAMRLFRSVDAPSAPIPQRQTMMLEIVAAAPVTVNMMLLKTTCQMSTMDATGTITTGTCTLGDIASWSTGTAPDSITSENQTRYITVSADTLDGYNTNAKVSPPLRRPEDREALRRAIKDGTIVVPSTIEEAKVWKAA